MKNTSACLLLILGGTLSAQVPNYFAPGGGDRANAWDAYLVIGGSATGDIAYGNLGDGYGASVDVGSYFQGGVGVGYNLNQYWNLNFELTVAAPTFTATIPDVGWYSNTVYLSNWKWNMDWHALPGPVTPLLTAGLGFKTLTTSTGDYVCYPGWTWGCYEVTNTEVAFTWNVGAGVRADLGNGVFLKAVVGAEWCLLNQADSLPYSFFGTLAVGLSFR